MLLAASGLLAGLDRPVLVGVLALTYVIWAAGLRVSLAANWSLLARTGTSTNVVSKAAHDLARARGASARVRRLAAAAGYVVCELAKEVPYYAGAFGAELASDAVSAGDAIIFLAGTNLGAGLYEYALGARHADVPRIDGAAMTSHLPACPPPPRAGASSPRCR